MNRVRAAAALLAVLCALQAVMPAPPGAGALGGVLTTAEPGPGYRVYLIDANGREIATTSVDVRGEYVFDGVPPGRYALGVGNPAADLPGRKRHPS